MSTTIKDFGRSSERFGDIPFYYGFEHRFWIGQHDIMPNDVLSWCRENCKDYYKVTCYTHKDSKRLGKTREFYEKVIFVDKVYLASAEDAEAMKAVFDIRSERIKRPRVGKHKEKRTINVK